MLKIFVEGKQDYLFLEALIQHHFPTIDKGTIEIIPTGGWKKVPTPKIEEFNDSGYSVLLIFDADFDPTGGIANRRVAINHLKEVHSIDFDLFLFPNNESDGALENLLEQVVHEDHRQIINCFEGYETCLSHLYFGENRKYQLPIQKSKIYAYVDSFPKSRREKEKFKKGDLFFTNQSIWNLNTPYITPLIKFIEERLNRFNPQNIH